MNKIFLLITLIFSESLFAYSVKVSSSLERTFSGVFIRKSQNVTITATGYWQMGTIPGYKTPVDLRGNINWVPHPNNQPNGCLIAYLNEKKYFPNGNHIDFTAEHDALLSLGPNDGGLTDNIGNLTVTIQVKNGKLFEVELNPYENNFDKRLKKILSYDPSVLVQLHGKYVGHILQVSELKKIRDIPTFTQWFDRMYEVMLDLVGKTPFNGAIVYYIKTDHFSQGIGELDASSIYMTSGNPIRYRKDAQKYLFEVYTKNSTDQWGFIHEMGHNFSFTLTNHYMKDGLVEAGANIFTLYAWEKLHLKLSDHAKNYMQDTKKWWKAGENQESLKKEYWPILGLLMTIQKDYGWKTFQYFYRNSEKGNYATIRSWQDRWDAYCYYLSLGAKTNMTKRFKSWNISISPSVQKELAFYPEDNKWKKWADFFKK